MSDAEWWERCSEDWRRRAFQSLELADKCQRQTWYAMAVFGAVGLLVGYLIGQKWPGLLP